VRACDSPHVQILRAISPNAQRTVTTLPPDTTTFTARETCALNTRCHDQRSPATVVH